MRVSPLKLIPGAKKTPFDPKFFPAWVDSKLRFAKVLGSPLVALRHGKE